MGCVPSSLHKNVKFIIDDKVVTIPTDSNVISRIGKKVLEVRHLQASKTYTSYQFKVVHIEKEATNLKRKAEVLPPKFPMMAKMTFNPNKGLGKYSQGRKNLVKAIKVPYKAGLGFKLLLNNHIKWGRKKK